MYSFGSFVSISEQYIWGGGGGWGVEVGLDLSIFSAIGGLMNVVLGCKQVEIPLTVDGTACFFLD